MNKTYKYTILTVLLTVIFSLGSMAGLNFILRAKEHQLLSKHGENMAESVVREWQKPKTLSLEQIEEVVRSCSEYKQMTVHDPVIGQISMAEAVNAGKVWLTQMNLQGYDWESDEETQIRSVYATLGTPDESIDVQVNPYYSFWKVHLSSRSMKIVLYINAVTANVWQAELTIYDNPPERMPYWKLKEFLELSGLTPNYKGAIRNEEETSAVWYEKDSRLCARMDFSYRNDNGYRKDLPDLDEEIVNENLMTRENAQIIMKLAIREETEGNEKP